MMDTIRRMSNFTEKDPWYNKEDKIWTQWLKSCSKTEQKGLKVLGWVIRYKGEFPVKHRNKQFTECKLSLIKTIQFSCIQ